MVRPLSESNATIKIALLFLLISLVLFLIGFSTPHWNVISQSGLAVMSFGLWQRCVEVLISGNTFCSSSLVGPGHSWISIVKALQCVGLIGLLLTMAATVLNIFVVRMTPLKQAAIFIIVLSGIAILVGCIYFAVKTNVRYLGYSYSLCCAGGSGAMVVGFLLCLDVRNERPPEPQPTIHYQPGQPCALPSGPYPGQVLSPPPTALKSQEYRDPIQSQPQYPPQGYAEQGYAGQGYAGQGYTEPNKT